VFHGYASGNGKTYTPVFDSRVVLRVMYTFDGCEPCEDGETSSETPNAVEFARTQLGFEPDERQVEVLMSSAKTMIGRPTRATFGLVCDSGAGTGPR
jgi:hypothetical protein